jgi:dTDP-4-amino-4,6-dideoxygalactose transaminase
MSDWRISLSDLDFGAEEEAAALRVVRSRWLSMGPEVEAFERSFAGRVGTTHALGMANGTAAIHLAYLALGIGPGDEVIQPAINFVASANMTLAIGATPVFADIIELGEPTIDPDQIERLITPRTKAVVVMHYGGYFCRMAEITEICRRHRVAIIEDACHAVGGRFLEAQSRPPHGRGAGNLGDIACFSFFSNKNLAIGEGGAVTTNRDDLKERLRLLRSHGMSTLTWDRHRGHASSYDVSVHGYNYRMDEIHAALASCQLAKLDRNNDRRRVLVAAYRAGLAGLPGWILPFAEHRSESACHLMVAVAPDHETRERVANELRTNRIQTSLHYPAIPEFSAFAAYQPHGGELSRSFAQRTITLPLYPTMTQEQVELVSGLVRQAAAGVAERVR